MTGGVEAAAPGAGYLRQVRHRFARNRLALASLAGIGLLALTALGADLLAGNRPYYMVYGGQTYCPAFRQYLVHLGLADWQPELVRRKNLKKLDVEAALYPPIPYGPGEIQLGETYRPPDRVHLLGTDRLGRDVLAGLIHGSRYALVIGLVSVSISLAVGVLLGALAGYFGGWTDLLLSRLFELWSSIPVIFLLITAAAFFPPSLFFVMIIIGLTGWMTIARLMRSQILHVRSFEYVEAARSLGCPTRRLIVRHILPNAIAPVLVPATFGVGLAILYESGLSFLGIGVPAEAITWGAILAGARSNASAWWLAVAPGVAIFVTITLYNLVSDGLRDALDPKMATPAGRTGS